MKEAIVSLKDGINSVDYVSGVAAAVSDSELAIIDPTTSSLIARHSIQHSSPLTCVALLSSTHAVVAGQMLSLVDLSSGLVLRNYTGHSTSVTCAATLPDDRLITAASDKFLSVWDMSIELTTQSRKRRRKAASSSALHTLIAPAPVSSLTVSSLESLTIAAVCTSCGVAVWTDYQVQDTPTTPSFIVRLPDSAPPLPLFDATFVKTGKLAIFYGNAYSPSVYSTKTGYDTDQELPLVSHNVLMENAMANPLKKEQAKLDLVDKIVSAEVSNSNTQPVRRKANGAVDDDDDHSQEDGDKIEAEIDLEPTVEEKLASLGIRRDPTSARSSALPEELLVVGKMDSRVSVLLQAIRSKDPVLFDNCVQSVSDREIIRQTVDLVPGSVAAEELIAMLVRRLQNFPRRADSLIPWIREVLIEHASALISQPKNEVLNELLGIIDNRTRSLEALSRLEGRLELVIGQVQRLKKAQGPRAEYAIPDAEYTEERRKEEEEDEEQDEMQNSDEESEDGDDSEDDDSDNDGSDEDEEDAGDVENKEKSEESKILSSSDESSGEEDGDGDQGMAEVPANGVRKAAKSHSKDGSRMNGTLSDHSSDSESEESSDDGD